MKPDLSKLFILITGAGRGLGRHAAEHLASCGAVIGVTDIDEVTCQETVEAITAMGNNAFAYTGDMSDQATFLKIADDFAAHGGRIDCIINNAMILHYEPVEKVEPLLLDKMLSIGVKAPLWSAQALLKHYDQERGASMINVSSPVVNRGYPNTVVYSAVKGAIASLTRVLSAELGPRGIRVNAVSPGSVPTPGAMGLNSEEEYAKRSKTIPLRRLGREEDNSHALAFLLSEEASFFNGEILNIDGGIAAAGGS